MPFVLAYINWKFWKKRKRENNKNNPYDLSSFFTWRWHLQHRAEWEKKNLERVFIIPFWRCMTGVTWEKRIPNWAAYQYSTSVRQLSSHYTHQIRLSMTLKKSNVLHISNEGRWRKKKWGENMSQEHIPSLITPLGRFIFSSVFSFSLLAVCWEVSEAIRGWEEKKLHNGTETQATFSVKIQWIYDSYNYKTSSLQSTSFSLISDEDTI